MIADRLKVIGDNLDDERLQRLKNLSGTPALAAAVAPPDLKLWSPKFVESNPTSVSFSLSNSRILL